MQRNDEELCNWASTRGIMIYRRSKTVWIAAGGYRGRDFEVKGRSPSIAVALWLEATQYRGSRC
jgi:hypothetical protein